MKHSCRNCHFLSKSYIEGKTKTERFSSWNANERRLGKLDKRRIELDSCCQRGVWHTGVEVGVFRGPGEAIDKNSELKSNLEDVIDKNRKHDCFFIRYSEGMSFDGAIELHRIRYENHNLRRSLRYAVTGLYVSGVAALLNFLEIGNVAMFFRWVSKSIVDLIGL